MTVNIHPRDICFVAADIYSPLTSSSERALILTPRNTSEKCWTNK